MFSLASIVPFLVFGILLFFLVVTVAIVIAAIRRTRTVDYAQKPYDSRPKILGGDGERTRVHGGQSHSSIGGSGEVFYEDYNGQEDSSWSGGDSSAADSSWSTDSSSSSGDSGSGGGGHGDSGSSSW